jgi:hypothetical protein
MIVGKQVTRCAVRLDGTITVGTYDDNPMLCSTVYNKVAFPDSQLKDYTANVIAESILTLLDAEGFSRSTMRAIVDREHRKGHSYT